MQTLFDFLFQQYSGYSNLNISLEITAVVFGLLSVVFSKKNNILVFPTGMISTLIFVYLLYQWELLGDMMINAYYFIMSIYGWYIWTRKDSAQHDTPISTTTLKEKRQSLLIFVATVIFVVTVYSVFNKFNQWTAYVDTITTAIFFVAMWLMAKRKIENWIYWIIGDMISIPLYFYKGLTFSSFQYIVFTILAILGYQEWKKIIKNEESSDYRG